MKTLKWATPFALIVAGLLFSTVFAGAPTGAGPSDPLMVTGAAQSIPAKTTLWFYFDYTGDRSKIEIFLDTFGASNVQLAIYTPEQARAWQSDPTTRPVGLGTPPNPNSSAAIHDLVWLGAFNFPGRFFAVVTNNNASAVSVLLTIKGDNVALAPTPTPTPLAFLVSPFAASIPTATLEGKFVLQESSGGNIYTVNGDGSKLTRVTYGLDPAWSPDGKRIAFARWDEPSGLYVADADGKNERALFGAPSLLSPRWSPDGSRIVFTRQKGGTSESQFCFGRFCFATPADPFWKLGIVDIASGALFEPGCSKHCFAPSWSTDNQTIAYADATVGILAASTVTSTLTTLYNQNPQVQSAIWSPDGARIAFQVRAHDHWEISVMNADGGMASPVTRTDPLSFKAVNNVAPAWSPDGKQILFLSDRNGKWEFFAVNADGSNLRQVLKSVTDITLIRYNFSNERVADWTK